MGETAAKRRMGLLYHNGYVKRRDESNQHKIFKGGVYWLDKHGAELVAQTKGYEDFRTFRWKKEPRFMLFHHDLTLNDVRIQLTSDCLALPGHMAEWVSEYAFRQNPDSVTFTAPATRGQPSAAEKQREVVPDGFGHLIVPGTTQHPELHFRVLLEVDLATETRKGQFGRDKVLPLVAYLESEAYHQRFGSRSGRVLVVTTTQTRLSHIKRQTQEYGGKGYFYFTTLEQFGAGNALLTPIWMADGADKPVPLLPHLTP
jgi:hypothetical protein